VPVTGAELDVIVRELRQYMDECRCMMDKLGYIFSDISEHLGVLDTRVQKLEADMQPSARAASW
jgi:hypothetical protein